MPLDIVIAPLWSKAAESMLTSIGSLTIRCIGLRVEIRADALRYVRSNVLNFAKQARNEVGFRRFAAAARGSTVVVGRVRLLRQITTVMLLPLRLAVWNGSRRLAVTVGRSAALKAN